MDINDQNILLLMMITNLGKVHLHLNSLAAREAATGQALWNHGFNSWYFSQDLEI
jgi:hypothetical protein